MHNENTAPEKTADEPTTATRSRWWAWLRQDEDLRRWLRGLILVGFTLFFVIFFGFMAFSILIDPDSWVMDQIKDHFAGTIGIAFAALASLFIVLLLQYTVGHIRLKGLGFEFEGASAPTVLWLFCFLAIAGGMKMLWST